jgi:hypothetical protein
MDYTSLDEITKTIIAIIQNAVDPTNTTKVLPELLRNNIPGVGFYLFHVQENSHYKNYPAPGNDTPPVNFTPMSLNLFYQLSANWKEDDVEDALQEQALMSVAMKALHDNAIITKIPPTISPGGKDIDIKITLQTLTPSESVQYWAAADSPVRLSAYYEVSVVFLRPEISRSYSGRVLKYGNYIFVRSAPQITASENTIQYKIPGDPIVKEVTISPAQVPPNLPGPPDNNSLVTFTGTEFAANAELFLISSIWPGIVVADAPWTVKVANGNKLTAFVRQTARLKATLAVVDVVPGLYAAQIAVTEVRTLPDLTTKTFVHTSNQFPFSVIPRIDSIAPLTGNSATTFTIKGYLFQHASILPGNVQVYIGGESLTFVSGVITAAGEFNITAFDTLNFRPFSPLPIGLVSVRVLVNGVESPPNWITGI